MCTGGLNHGGLGVRYFLLPLNDGKVDLHVKRTNNMRAPLPQVQDDVFWYMCHSGYCCIGHNSKTPLGDESFLFLASQLLDHKR